MGRFGHFPHGVSSFGIPIFGSGGFFPTTQGKVFHVKPYSGVDTNDGLSPSKALKTLAKALERATADQNDIVYLYAESNTAASTTDYQSSTLDWNKDGVHLIGVNNGTMISQRSRVAFISTYDTASNLFTLSADNCLVANIEFYAGVAGTSPTGCMKVSGQRNHFVNCQISGIGHANNDISGAYSLYLNGADECVFDGCYIGLDTVTRDTAATTEILVDGASTRNMFRDCLIVTYAGHATNACWLKCGNSAIDRFLLFKKCFFFNPSGTNMSGATAMTGGFQITAGALGGAIILEDTNMYGATDWNAASHAAIVGNAPVPTATTSGIAIAYTT